MSARAHAPKRGSHTRHGTARHGSEYLQLQLLCAGLGLLQIASQGCFCVGCCLDYLGMLRCRLSRCDIVVLQRLRNGRTEGGT